jgi:hypothetical protein
VTQLVLVTPVLLLAVLLVVQLALWMHAAQVADAAAAKGAAAAALRSGTAADGVQAASVVVTQAGSVLAAPPRATRGTTATVEVRVRLTRIVPGLPSVVTRRAVAPVERFLPESRR